MAESTLFGPLEYLKRCRCCNVVKPMSEFHFQIQARDKRQSYCRSCMAPRRTNASTSRARSRALKLRPDHDKRKKQARECFLKKKYGIADADYLRMEQEQKGRCAICGTQNPTRGIKKRFAVDHCHKTKKLRRLLCGNCNLGLGNFKDSIKLMKLAIGYLESYGGGAD